MCPSFRNFLKFMDHTGAFDQRLWDSWCEVMQCIIIEWNHSILKLSVVFSLFIAQSINQWKIENNVQGLIRYLCKVLPVCMQDLECGTGWWRRALPWPLVLASSTSLCWSSSSCSSSWTWWSFFSSSHTGEALQGTSIVTLSSKCIWSQGHVLLASQAVVRISCCVTTCNSQKMYFQ